MSLRWKPTRFAGKCKGCGCHVAAGTGHYDYGVITCGDWDYSTMNSADMDIFRAWRKDNGVTVVCASLVHKFRKEYPRQ